MAIKKYLTNRYLTYLFIFLTCFGLAHFSIFYYLHYPIQKDYESFYPSKQVAQFALANINNYDQIVIDRQFGKNGPYLVGTPDLYLKFYGHIKLGQESKIAKISQRHIDWAQENKHQNYLLIGSPWSLKESEIIADNRGQILKRFYFTDGQVAYLAVKVN